MLSLANPSSANSEDSQGWTPVHLACASGDSEIFHSQQVSRQNNNRSYTGFEGGLHKILWGRSYDGDNERATAIGILEILLQHYPNFDGPQNQTGWSHCPTALHCAANSGWLSHARALVEAGAQVYTGPGCSPICWAKHPIGGDQAVTLFLKDMLGERGLAMVKEDHGLHPD